MAENKHGAKPLSGNDISRAAASFSGEEDNKTGGRLPFGVRHISGSRVVAWDLAVNKRDRKWLNLKN